MGVTRIFEQLARVEQMPELSHRNPGRPRKAAKRTTKRASKKTAKGDPKKTVKKATKAAKRRSGGGSPLRSPMDLPTVHRLARSRQIPPGGHCRQRVESVVHALFGSWHQVAVAVEREADRRVTGPRRDLLR